MWHLDSKSNNESGCVSDTCDGSALSIEMRMQQCVCFTFPEGEEDVSVHFGRNRFKSQPCHIV